LTVAEVVEVIVGQVLRTRPLEVAIPTGRGLLARAGGLAPGLALKLYPAMKKKGLDAQRRTGR